MTDGEQCSFSRFLDSIFSWVYRGLHFTVVRKAFKHFPKSRSQIQFKHFYRSIGFLLGQDFTAGIILVGWSYPNMLTVYAFVIDGRWMMSEFNGCLADVT